MKITVVLEAFVQTSYETYTHKYKTIDIEIPDDGNEWHVAGEMEALKGGWVMMDDKEFYDKYPCVHRAEDGACAACAYMCDCGWPEDCKLREEALKDGSTTD